MRNLKSSSLYIEVYKEIRDYIIDNQLQAGNKLPTELELSETLGVSRNVVREALKALQLIGIVTPIPSKGYVVTSFSFDNIYEQMVLHLLPSDSKLRNEMDQIRMVLEQYFLDEMIDNLSEDALRKMREAVDAMEICYQNGDKMFEYDRMFHTALYENVNNEMFHSIERVTWDLHPLARLPKDDCDLKRDWENHKAIYEAVEQRNKALAKALLLEHMWMSPE